MSRDALRISGLRVRYAADAEVALAIDALAIAAGERVALIGPSGSGKTTLLRAVHGLVAPEAGTVTLDGVATASAAARSRAFRRRHAAVFQEFQLVERASVLANVLCGRLGHAPVLPSLFGLFAAADREAARSRRRGSPDTGTAAPTPCRAGSASAWRSPARSPRRRR